jgi:hypothetical protein
MRSRGEAATAKCVLLAVPLALTAAMAWPFDPVTVELHHRSAESLITVLRPLIAPATLAGSGTRVQVRAAPPELARVVRLVEQSDRPLRPLAVTLRDEAPPSADSNPRAADGSVTLSTGRALPADSYGNGQTLSTQPHPRTTELAEGDPLLISMPATQSLLFRVKGAGARASGHSQGGGAAASPGGPVVAGAAHFDAVSDFTARIWLAGETVAIDLQPRAAGRLSADPDANFEGATVYGRLGQWIALSDSGTGGAASNTPSAGLWIKVEAAPEPDRMR